MSPSRPSLPFEQPALPELEAAAVETPATPDRPAARGRARLAVVAELVPRSLDERAADVMATLDAAGLFPDQHQARALAAAGMLAPHAWAAPEYPEHRRAEAAAIAAAIRQDVARRRAAAAHAYQPTTPTRREPR